MIDRPATNSCFFHHLSKKCQTHLLSLLNAEVVSEHIFGLGASKKRAQGVATPHRAFLPEEPALHLQAWPHLGLSSYLPPAFAPPEVDPFPASLSQGPLDIPASESMV